MVDAWLTERIAAKLTNGQNVILKAPRGAGIASMAHEIIFKVTEKQPGFLVCSLDLLNIFTREAFRRLFIREITKIVAPGKTDKLLHKLAGDEIYSLPRLLAKQEKIKILISIKHFQNIARFERTAELQQKLRFKWKSQTNCVYLLSGSSKRLMVDMFQYPLKPLSKSGKVYTLKITRLKDVQEQIKKYFLRTGKCITPEASNLITSRTQDHPFYTGLLVWHAWVRTTYLCTGRIVNEALDTMILHYNHQFQLLLENLTNKQLNFLKAGLDAIQHFCSTDSLQAYNMGKSSNVARARESLIKKEIIEVYGNEIEFVDPIFRYWLTKRIFSSSNG